MSEEKQDCNIAIKTNLYNDDPPTIIHKDGCKEWFKNGKKHRENNPAVIWTINGTHCEEWWFEGKRHRVDGPAFTLTPKYEEWWFNGVKHRDDGPAVIWTSGQVEFWKHGTRVK